MPNKVLLKIENLRVKANHQEILKGINLKIEKKQIQAILGPNGSGKSVLCQTILGNPKYKITQGKIIFQEKNINKLPPEKRVKLGLALSWQNPPSLRGIKLVDLLKKISQEKIKIEEGKHLLNRQVNLDFSGGEKKISELLQLLSLKPKLVIFDEIDSGLDLEKIKKIAKIIKKEFVDRGISLLIITHNGEILKFLKPQLTNVMIKGKIVCQQKNFQKVLKTIKKYGYEKCQKCLS